MSDSPFFTVCTFLVDKAYGGPEEGGWYYEVGEPVTGAGYPIPRITKDIGKAVQWREEMQKHLDNTVNVGRREISSVLSDGMYYAEICEGLPEAYPACRPHYE